MAKYVPFAVVAFLAVAVSGGKWYWQRRIGRQVEVCHKLQHQRIKPEMWPSEPTAPNRIADEAFRDALSLLCGPMPPARLEKYAAAILTEAARFEIDPFVLAALIYDQSRCLPKTPDGTVKYGLARIDVDMHAPHIRGGRYKYFLLENGRWTPRFLHVDAYPFNKWKAAKWSSNIYFAAAFLKVFKMQCPHLDSAFKGVGHRHHLSHWFFGEKVLEIEPEDRVLTVRRRLLDYYAQKSPAAAGVFSGISLVSPLDGAPRVVLDDFGNRRGNRRGPGHQGIDITAQLGEPVRAAGAGRVVFAGADLKGQGGSKQLSPKQAAAFPQRSAGAGGLYVAINHGKGFRTYYMHLDSIAVQDRDEIEAGHVIGTVGRSGTVTSGPHLHLEFRLGTQRVDPALPLSSVLVDPSRFEKGSAGDSR